MQYRLTKLTRRILLLGTVSLAFASCMGDGGSAKQSPGAPTKEVLPTAPNVILKDSSGVEPATLSIDTSLKHHHP